CAGASPVDGGSAGVAKAKVADAKVGKAKIAGKWSLGTAGSPKFQFRQDGTFEYAGWGNSSRGNWSFDGSCLRLIWTHVDGYKVAPGTMHARYPISADGVLQIDKFAYRRAS